MCLGRLPRLLFPLVLLLGHQHLDLGQQVAVILVNPQVVLEHQC